MDEVSTLERIKYERMWALSEYRDDHVTAHADRALAVFRSAPGESLIDFGAGAGYASARLMTSGLRVLAVDIAVNAMAAHLVPDVPRLLASLWEIPVSLRADWGFCCDVMEHVPPDRVHDVLRAIRASTRRATYFCISLRPDGCGVLIDDALHLTVQPLEWWLARLRTHWAHLRVLDHIPHERAVLVAGLDSDPPASQTASPPTATELSRTAVYLRRMTTLAQRMVRAGIRECLVFGSGEAGQALAAVAPATGLVVRGFVQSAAVAAHRSAGGLPMQSVADAAAGACHTYAIGSFSSAPAMIASLESAYARRGIAYSVYLPDGPAPR